ncbi:hypothetical protein GEO35_05795 [Bifidobacterium breve]|nr:hypothetical protein GEO35_05795 [Bifidobacterium breve]QHP50654.1 hypothetical protein D3H49_00640 [Bifidobacterium breve]TQC89858.1 hypothetical protein FKD14_02475 [Bifidobacterium breve]
MPSWRIAATRSTASSCSPPRARSPKLQTRCSRSDFKSSRRPLRFGNIESQGPSRLQGADSRISGSLLPFRGAGHSVKRM